MSPGDAGCRPEHTPVLTLTGAQRLAPLPTDPSPSPRPQALPPRSPRDTRVLRALLHPACLGSPLLPSCSPQVGTLALRCGSPSGPRWPRGSWCRVSPPTPRPQGWSEKRVQSCMARDPIELRHTGPHRVGAGAPSGGGRGARPGSRVVWAPGSPGDLVCIPDLPSHAPAGAELRGSRLEGRLAHLRHLHTLFMICIPTFWFAHALPGLVLPAAHVPQPRATTTLKPAPSWWVRVGPAPTSQVCAESNRCGHIRIPTGKEYRIAQGAGRPGLPPGHRVCGGALPSQWLGRMGGVQTGSQPDHIRARLWRHPRE